MFHITTCSLLDFIEINKRTLSEGSGELASLFKKKSEELTHNVSCVANFSKLAISTTPKIPFRRLKSTYSLTLAQNLLPYIVKSKRAEIDMCFSGHIR